MNEGLEYQLEVARLSNVIFINMQANMAVGLATKHVRILTNQDLLFNHSLSPPENFVCLYWSFPPFETLSHIGVVSDTSMCFLAF